MKQIMEAFEQELVCPISKTYLIDPVCTVDGHTYEKKAIEHWFLTSRKSPKTGLDLSNKILIPNLATILTTQVSGDTLTFSKKSYQIRMASFKNLTHICQVINIQKSYKLLT